MKYFNLLLKMLCKKDASQRGFTLVEMMVTVAIGGVVVLVSQSMLLNVIKANEVAESEYNRFLIAGELRSYLLDIRKLNIQGFDACINKNADGTPDCSRGVNYPLTVSTKTGKVLTGKKFTKKFQPTTEDAEAYYYVTTEGSAHCLSGYSCDQAAYISVNLKFYFKNTNKIYAQISGGMSLDNDYGLRKKGCVDTNGNPIVDTDLSQFPYLPTRMINGQLICDLKRVTIDGVDGQDGKPLYHDTSGEVMNDPWW